MENEDEVSTGDLHVSFFITFTCLNNFTLLFFLVKHSHHWKKRQALIDDIIAHDVGEDEEFAADDEYPDLHSNFATKASELRELHEKCNWKHAHFGKLEIIF